MARTIVVLSLLFSLPQPAHAWETDQLTRRGEPLDDVTDAANAWLDAAFARAAAATNRATRCHATPARTHEVLAAQVRREAARDTPVRGRGFVRSLGYGALSAWLETADVPRRSFLDRSDVFGGIPARASLILADAGTSSTVRLGGVLVGTDKPDHFFEDGWRYFRHGGVDHPERAVAWGTWTEDTFLGLYTSSAFSFADLHANWQGYRFYVTLLDPELGDFTLGDDGCVRVRRPFDLGRWVDWRWDEVLNPSVYTRKVQAWLDERLPARRDEVCAAVRDELDEIRRRHEERAREQVVWVGEGAPPPGDPFRLVALCGG